MKDHTCPRCGGGIPNDEHRGLYPGATSRVDNKTEICSACGVDEAMGAWAAHMERIHTDITEREAK